MHARSGGRLEVMGMMLGKMEGPTMIVTDTFALPVDGTETRVNAHEEANEYMVGYMSLIRQVSHPSPKNFLLYLLNFIFSLVGWA